MKNPQILPAIAVAIFDDYGHILLQKRRDRNCWGLISGHVEFGESVEEAAKREIKEETGLQASITRLIGVYSEPASQTYTYDSGVTAQYVTTYFEGRIEGTIDTNLQNEETLGLAFFNPDQLPDNLLSMHPMWLKDALQQNQIFIR